MNVTTTILRDGADHVGFVVDADGAVFAIATSSRVDHVSARLAEQMRRRHPCVSCGGAGGWHEPWGAWTACEDCACEPGVTRCPTCGDSDPPCLCDPEEQHRVRALLAELLAAAASVIEQPVPLRPEIEVGAVNACRTAAELDALARDGRFPAGTEDTATVWAAIERRRAEVTSTTTATEAA